MSTSWPCASVVSTEQLITGSASGFALSRHTVHRPAMARLDPSFGVMKNGCLRSPSRFHSNQPSAGRMHRRLAIEVRNAGLVAALSTRALIIFAPILRSLAQCGTRPQRISWMPRTVLSRSGSPSASRGWCATTTGTCLVGATLWSTRTSASPVSSSASNSLASVAGSFVDAYLPHT